MIASIRCTEFEEPPPVGQGCLLMLPWLDRWIERTRDHRWAPRHLKEFENLTDPTK